jgi:hypothetical protein
MSVTTLPVVQGGQHPDESKTPREQREGAIRAGVLAALGRPGRLFRVAVLPLWGDHFRVNVITGDDPTSVRIPHSYFVAADGRGNIIESTPHIRKEYPLSP